MDAEKEADNLGTGIFSEDNEFTVKTGTDGDDQIEGDDLNDYISGLDNNDSINGNGGNDLIVDYQLEKIEDLKENSFYSSEADKDSLNGGMGDDTLVSMSGADTLDGGEGVDAVYWNLSDQTDDLDLSNLAGSVNLPNIGSVNNFEIFHVIAGKGKDTITGGAENDFLDDGNFGDVSRDKLSGEAGDDTITSGGGKDTLDGGEGFDSLHLDLSQQTQDLNLAELTGLVKVPRTVKFSNFEVFNILGGEGKDTIAGASGNDSLNSGDEIYYKYNEENFQQIIADDSITGGEGDDSITSEGGKDTLDGGQGFDYLDLSFALEFQDLNLAGGSGKVPGGVDFSNFEAVSIIGGYGNDTLTGGSGNDYLAGAMNFRDYYDKFHRPSKDVLSGGDGDDTIVSTDGLDTLDGGDGFDSLILDFSEQLYLLEKPLDIKLKDLTSNNKIANLASFTNFEVFNITTGDGNDLLVGREGDDYLDAGSGNNKLSGSEGNDTLIGSYGKDRLAGNAGNDSLAAGDNQDYLKGKEGNDTLEGGGDNDILSGGDDDDRLAGGKGEDLLTGGKGEDLLTGGKGSDRFTFTGSADENIFLSADKISDFAPGNDHIVLGQISFNKLADKLVESNFALVTSDDQVGSSDAFIVYNSSNGNLYYNPNGKDSDLGDGGVFASLTNKPTLTLADFEVIS